MAYCLKDNEDYETSRVLLLDMRTRHKSYQSGEIISIVEFSVSVPEIPGKRYTMSAPYIWGIGWSIEHARCSPSFPREFHIDAFNAVNQLDEDLVCMDEQEQSQALI